MGLGMRHNLCKSVTVYSCIWTLLSHCKGRGSTYEISQTPLPLGFRVGSAGERAWKTRERSHSLLSGSACVSSSSDCDSSHGEGDSKGDSSSAVITQAPGIPLRQLMSSCGKPLVETDPGLSLVCFPFLLLQPIAITSTCISSSLFEIPVL